MADVTEEERRKQAYELTQTDGQAAEVLGLTRDTFRQWRQARGLPAKTRGGRPMLTSKLDIEKVRKLVPR